MDEKQQKQDISDLLREANEQNERDRALQEKRTEREEQMAKTIIAPPVRESTSEGSDEAQKRPIRDLDAETIELIDKYSTREIRDEKSDTQELRETLAKKLQGDKLLGGYLDQKMQTNAPRAETLRTLIRKADQMSAEEMERHASNTDPSGRFSDEDELPEAESFEQAEMFPLGDRLPPKGGEREWSAGFDRDYEKLGEKVVGNGIYIPSEEDDESQLSFLPEETDVEPIKPEMDEKELHLRLAFDMMEEGETDTDAAKAKPVSEKKQRRDEEPALRYVSRSQNMEFAEKLQKRVRTAWIRFGLVSALMLILWYFEASGENGILGFLLRHGIAGERLYIALDLQLLCLCGLAVLPLLTRGVRGFLAHKLVPESMLVCGLFFSAVYSVFQLIFVPSVSALRLYALPIGLSAVCAALADALTAVRNRHAFRTIASKRPKYVARRLENTVKEAEEFSRHLYEDSELYTVCRTDFVEGFSERIIKRPKYDDWFHFLMPTMLIAAAALFTALLLLGRPADEAFRAFSTLIAFSVPSTAFFLFSLPLSAATRRARKCSGAFIGDGIAEEYAMAAALTFADTEVYPANMVSITSVKTYGEYRIDKVIPDVAKVFSFLGGPLAKVTQHMIDGEVEKPGSARVIENASDGICVAIDGRHVFLGKRSYLRRYRFDAPVDQGDEGYEKGVGSVMYVVFDEQLAAKFYIRYRINPRFEQLLQDLYRANLCLGIKTMDPNITGDMIMGSIRFRKCPIAVLKQDSPSDIAGEAERMSGGVVCNSSLHNFLRMFSLCDKIRHITRCNAIISTVSVVMSAIAVAFLAVMGNLQEFGAVQAMVFQLCWQIPIWLLSFFIL